jgi:hypothetical protein
MRFGGGGGWENLVLAVNVLIGAELGFCIRDTHTQIRTALSVCHHGPRHMGRRSAGREKMQT